MTMDHSTQRQIRILRAYTVVSTTILGFLAITAFHRASDKPRFEEIDVERINLVAPRLFVGRDTRKAAVVDLKDQFGRSRLRLAVDSSVPRVSNS
jgi:hypothetical protein